MELKTPPAGCVKAIALPVLLHDHYFKTSIFSAKRCCCIFFLFTFFLQQAKGFEEAVLFFKLCCSEKTRGHWLSYNYSLVAKENKMIYLQQASICSTLKSKINVGDHPWLDVGKFSLFMTNTPLPSATVLQKSCWHKNQKEIYFRYEMAKFQILY